MRAHNPYIYLNLVILLQLDFNIDNLEAPRKLRQML